MSAKTFPSLINQIPSAVANDPAMSSDSIDDRDTLVLLLPTTVVIDYM